MTIATVNSSLTISQAKELDEDARLEFLRSAWKTEDDLLFGVFHSWNHRPRGIEWFLTDIHNSFGEPLDYPLVDLDAKFSLHKCAPHVELRSKDNSRRDAGHLPSLESKIVRARFRMAMHEGQADEDNPLLIYFSVQDVSAVVELPRAMLSLSEKGFVLSESLYTAIISEREPELSNAVIKLQAKKEDLSVKVSEAEVALAKAKENADQKMSEKQVAVAKEIDKLMTSTAKKKMEIADSLEVLKAEREVHQNKLDSLHASLKALEPKQEELERNADLYFRVGLLGGDEYRQIKEVTSRRSNSDAFDDKVSGIVQRYLARERSLLYPRYLIDEFLSLLLTHDLILLTGTSGVGKTSLVRGTADAIGGTWHVIPVKPNWMSSEDLVGFMHPTSRRFHPGPLLDAFDAADMDKTRLHLICLDEMNLARIEYYFSDFISGLEDRDKSRVSLYPQAIADELKELARLNIPLPEAHSSPWRAPIRMIPENVRFVGCLNVDDTTQPLSPKLRDRAHVMRLTNSAPVRLSDISRELEDEGPIESIALDATKLPSRTEYPKLDEQSQVYRKMEDWSRKFLAPLGSPVSARVMRQAMWYDIQFASSTGATLGSQLPLNSILLHKILPRFTFDGKQKIPGGSRNKLELLTDFMNDLRTSCKPEEWTKYQMQPLQAADEIERIIENASVCDDMVDYWA